MQLTSFSQARAIGVDLGGTKIEIGLVNQQGEVKERIRFPTRSEAGPDAVIKEIADAAKKLIAEAGVEPEAVGVGMAGQVEKGTGIIHHAPNLGWHEVDLAGGLGKLLNLPVKVCNDVRAATWGEWLYGAGKDCNDLVCVFVGTGIGGGIISGGQIADGFNNTAGEIGHFTIQMNGPECHCGNHGCFEALAGGWAIERDAKKLLAARKTEGKILLELAKGAEKNITTKMVSEAAEKGDALSKRILQDALDALIAGAAGIVNILGPQKLILGGGIMEGRPDWVKAVDEGLRKRALKAATDNVKVVPAALHNDSGVIGAAAFAMRNLE